MRPRPGGAFWLAFLCGGWLSAAWPQTPPDAAPVGVGAGAQRQLLGMIIAGQEVDTLEVIQDGGHYLLPLEAILDLLRAEIVRPPPALEVRTPLGSAVIPAGLLRESGHRWFIHERGLAERLQVLVRFDASKYALILDVPWRGEEKQEAPGPGGETPEIVPDFTPPAFGLSAFRAELDSVYREREGDTATRLDWELDGKLARGDWHVRLEDVQAKARLGAYYWSNIAGHRQVLLGKLYSPPAYVLPTLEFTGFQALFSSRALADVELGSSSLAGAAQILSRPQRDIEGSGPPAGTAELRIDDRVIARVRIGLDGRYQFREVPLPSGRFSRVEVLIYEREHSSTPIARRDYSRAGSTELLPEGESTLSAGGGGAGDWLDETGAAPHVPVGFLQWRKGVRDWLTLEAGAQKDREKDYATGGLIAGVGKNWLVSAAAGWTRGSLAYEVELQGTGRKWRLNAAHDSFGAGYKGNADTQDAYFAEYAYDLRKTLSVSLIGRDWQNDGERERFVLPAATWRPLPELALGARPNSAGDYRYDASLRLGRRFRASHAYAEGAHASDLEYDIDEGLSVYALRGASDKNAAPTSHEAGVYWQAPGAYRDTTTLQAAALHGGAEWGYRLRLQKTWRHGILSNLEIREMPGDGQGLTVSLNLVAEFTTVGGRLVPGRGMYWNRGGIAGGIHVRGGAETPDFSIPEAQLLINGLPREASAGDGRFFVKNLPPGTYQVELDSEKLPIELTPEKARYWVKVERNAITPVEFWVRAEYGAAGRVLDGAGAPVAGVGIEVRDTAGRIFIRTATDQFGLYRVDGLPAGWYTTRALADTEPQGRIAGEREFEIHDDFLFGQDIVIASPE